MSDRKPQLGELTRTLQDLTWNEVTSMALQLGMKYSKLKQIEEQDVKVSARLRSAMDLWLDSDANATWGKVVKALNDIDKKVLANEIEKYCQLSQPPSSPTLLPRKRKRRHSPTSPAPSPPPQSPQRPKLTTTQSAELPGWQTRVVRETKQEGTREIAEEIVSKELDMFGKMKEPVKPYVLDLHT